MIFHKETIFMAFFWRFSIYLFHFTNLLFDTKWPSVLFSFKNYTESSFEWLYMLLLYMYNIAYYIRATGEDFENLWIE